MKFKTIRESEVLALAVNAIKARRDEVESKRKKALQEKNNDYATMCEVASIAFSSQIAELNSRIDKIMRNKKV